MSTTMTTPTKWSDLPEEVRDDVLRYASDMAMVDAEIEAKLDRQIKIDSGNPDAERAIQRFHDDVRDQRDAMRALLASYDHELSTLRDTGAGLIGKVEGAVSQIRSESLSKALRDDYTSFGLGSVGYTMLYTTARAAKADEVATLARKGMETYATAIQTIAEMIPNVVLSELSTTWEQTLPSNVIDDVHKTTSDVWAEARNA